MPGTRIPFLPAGGAYVPPFFGGMYAPILGSATCRGATKKAHRGQVVAWVPSTHPPKGAYMPTTTVGTYAPPLLSHAALLRRPFRLSPAATKAIDCDILAMFGRWVVGRSSSGHNPQSSGRYHSGVGFPFHRSGCLRTRRDSRPRRSSPPGLARNLQRPVWSADTGAIACGVQPIPAINLGEP